METPETSELAAFVQVVITGSVSGAARELGLPRATISGRLQRLEDKLEIRLVQRTTRRLHLTDAGEAFFPHARSAWEAAKAAAGVVRRADDRPRGLLRVSTPPVQGLSRETVFGDILIEFMQRYPEVELEVITSLAHEDMLARNIDVALRAGAALDLGLTMRRLRTTEQVAVASPAYLERSGRLRRLADLTKHRCLVGFERGLRPETHWPLRDGGKVRVHGGLAANEHSLRFRAARLGLGVALLPRFVCEAALGSGELIHVLPRTLGGNSQLSVVYPQRQLMKASARAFIDLVVERFVNAQ
ncbi:MAG: LysR substrate-binding domain-containing protein [Nannocystales bacterium]